MKILLGAVLFIIIFLIGIRYIERRDIYFPVREIFTSPEIIGLPYQEIYFQTVDNKRLNSWFIPNDEAKFTVIFCHGNAGNISHRIEKIGLLHKLGLNIFIFDYRGYGKSQGSPCEPGLYKDAVAAYSYLVKERRISEDNIILYGESLGGAIAINLAHRVRVRALITEGTFTSIRDMAKITYPFLPYFIFSSSFNSISKIREVKCLKLIIHSIDDEIVPFYLGERLSDAAKSPKKFLKIRGFHNTAFLDSEEQFVEGIKVFLDDL
ncbi:MAG: alpha/beta hydrolase [Candidatus Kaelpia imicola]|nr:alpha/beta hydrolase [Candidatus Kaelpia imicola]